MCAPSHSQGNTEPRPTNHALAGAGTLVGPLAGSPALPVGSASRPFIPACRGSLEAPVSLIVDSYFEFPPSQQRLGLPHSRLFLP